MSDRILAQGIAESVARMTPPARPKHRHTRVRLGRAAALVGWLAVAVAVLLTLRAFAHSPKEPTMSTVFEFTYADGPVIARVEAANEREARAHLREATVARKLPVTEVIALAQAGKAIVSAKTGAAVGGESAQS